MVHGVSAHAVMGHPNGCLLDRNTACMSNAPHRFNQSKRSLMQKSFLRSWAHVAQHSCICVSVCARLCACVSVRTDKQTQQLSPQIAFSGLSFPQPRGQCQGCVKKLWHCCDSMWVQNLWWPKTAIRKSYLTGCLLSNRICTVPSWYVKVFPECCER